MLSVGSPSGKSILQTDIPVWKTQGYSAMRQYWSIKLCR